MSNMTYRDEEIREEIERQKQLPVTHRNAHPSKRDDVAIDLNGQPVHVPTPETPDDRFDG